MSVLPVSKLRRLSLGFPTLDSVFPGFELGDFAVLRGNAAPFLSFALSVRAQLSPEQDGLDSSIAFADGGNMFNPYLVAEIAREYGLDSRTVLQKIHVSRAFTAYQLSSLILEKLDSVLKRNETSLLIVSDVTSLFMDSDIPKTEAKELFMKICTKLSEVAARKQTTVVASYFPEKQSRQGLFLEAVLLGKCNILISMKKTGNVLVFALEDHPCFKPFSMDFTVDNPSLTSFTEV
jgi:hypothetical protein